jgi:capsid assembly protease
MISTLVRFSNELWAIDRVKLGQIIDFLVFRAAGGKLNETEREARTQSGARDREIAEAPGNVALIAVHGLIMPRVANLNLSESGVGLDGLANAFRAKLADNSIKAIIMEFDSPGGQTGGLDEFAQEIFEAREIKPVIAQVNSLAASAAYYLAAQASEIVASPSSRAGSIGIYAVHDDISARLESEGINRTIIASGPNKAKINFGPLSDEAREAIKRDVDFANEQFVKAVARGRNVSQKHVNENMGGGDIFNPPDLVKRKMADRIGSLKDTLARFGIEVSPAKRAQATAARAMLALGRAPHVSDLESLLRECGASKSLAASLASGALAGRDRSESGDDHPNRSESGGETGEITKTLDELRALRTALKSFDRS